MAAPPNTVQPNQPRPIDPILIAWRSMFIAMLLATGIGYLFSALANPISPEQYGLQLTGSITILVMGAAALLAMFKPTPARWLMLAAIAVVAVIHITGFSKVGARYYWTAQIAVMALAASTISASRLIRVAPATLLTCAHLLSLLASADTHNPIYASRFLAGEFAALFLWTSIWQELSDITGRTGHNRPAQHNDEDGFRVRTAAITLLILALASALESVFTGATTQTASVVPGNLLCAMAGLTLLLLRWASGAWPSSVFAAWLCIPIVILTLLFDSERSAPLAAATIGASIVLVNGLRRQMIAGLGGFVALTLGLLVLDAIPTVIWTFVFTAAGAGAGLTLILSARQRAAHDRTQGNLANSAEMDLHQLDRKPAQLAAGLAGLVGLLLTALSTVLVSNFLQQSIEHDIRLLRAVAELELQTLERLPVTAASPAQISLPRSEALAEEHGLELMVQISPEQPDAPTLSVRPGAQDNTAAVALWLQVGAALSLAFSALTYALMRYRQLNRHRSNLEHELVIYRAQQQRRAEEDLWEEVSPFQRFHCRLKPSGQVDVVWTSPDQGHWMRLTGTDGQNLWVSMTSIPELDNTRSRVQVLVDAARSGGVVSQRVAACIPGAPEWIDSRFVAVNGENGCIDIFGILMDATESVESRRALEQALSEAQAANRSKEAFIANLSHEIRTPLNGILGMLQLIAAQTDDGDMANRANEALHSSRMLRQLLNDILDYSRLQTHNVKLVHSPISLNGILESVRLLYEPLAQAQGLELITTSNCPASLSHIGDENRISQILSNLVSNAIKFTSSGSVTIELMLTRNADDSDIARFDVIDTGIGINEDQLHNLFQPFQQADDSISRRYGGTGLGLAICSQLAALMSASVSVQSQPGRGSRFSFELPLRQSLAGSQLETVVEQGAGDDHQILRGLRVLVVEDTPLNRRIMLAFLKRLGIEAMAANNGQEALDHLANSIPDLVLMDIQMPVMDGIEATRRIRGNDTLSHLTVIAVTAATFDDERRTVFDAGVDDFLAKPVELEELEATLKKWAQSIRRPQDGDA